MEQDENIFDDTALVMKKINGKSCLYKCTEPNGSVALSVLCMAFIFIMFPVLFSIIIGSTPTDYDSIISAVHARSCMIINYTGGFPIHELPFLFIGSLLAGIISGKPLKAVLVSLAFVGIGVLSFFFMSLFIMGFVIDYGLFFLSFFTLSWFLQFIIVILLALVLGAFVARVMYGRKKCYILNNATIIT